jgi:energy-coupling factor transport system permease protein
MRAACTGVLDRALDVAAALEVRGYGAARRPPAYRAPYSRHDAAFLASAVAVVAVSVVARVDSATTFAAYPSLRLAAGAPTLLLAGALVAAALLPFADRRGL